MFGCMFQPITAANIRAASLSCLSFATQPAGVGRSVTFWFEPQ